MITKMTDFEVDLVYALHIDQYVRYITILRASET
jgi:hypothetical protein